MFLQFFNFFPKNLKRQSEHSGLRPDTSSLVKFWDFYLCYEIKVNQLVSIKLICYEIKTNQLMTTILILTVNFLQ